MSDNAQDESRADFWKYLKKLSQEGSPSGEDVDLSGKFVTGGPIGPFTIFSPVRYSLLPGPGWEDRLPDPSPDEEESDSLTPRQIDARRHNERFQKQTEKDQQKEQDRSPMPTTTQTGVAATATGDELFKKLLKLRNLSMINDPEPEPNEDEAVSNAQSPLVLHIPHASTVIPDWVRPMLLLTEAEVQKELLRMTDAYTDELFRCDGVARIQYPVSRIVVDPERFENDADEVMSQVGMGAVYTSTSDGRPLRHVPTPWDRETLLAAYYRPHHSLLTDAVARAVRHNGRCLVVDCHSFPSYPLQYELDQRLDRPDIGVGTDPFHTPAELADEVIEGFKLHGYTVAVNRPYAGALVPATFYRRDANVAALMIEVNRALYMDEWTGAKSSRFDETLAAIAQVLARLNVAKLGTTRSGLTSIDQQT